LKRRANATSRGRSGRANFSNRRWSPNAAIPMRPGRHGPRILFPPGNSRAAVLRPPHTKAFSRGDFMRRFSVLLLGIALAASARAAEPFVASTARRFAEGIIAEQQNEIQMMH